MEGGDPPLCGGHPESGPRGRPRRSPTRTRLRNRRFAALRRLIREGRYFSEREMRLRAPRLYQRHIGRFGGGGDPETPPGDPASAPPGPPSLAQLLLKALEQEAPQPTDDESSDDSGDPPAGERPLLRREFLALMYQRFLDGEDPDFDYSQVDENPDMDDLEAEAREAEERYFDTEEPGAAPPPDWSPPHYPPD
ncbi:coiled-coil domain-containing protein 97 isoform X6 [Patagioenas fasciata]|uniref:coiled-coil domain-containing protein 97 isoform X6 n=1 Tax=Patagioenas fasciata TaxID=372321 RepID=UPI003A994657